VTEFTFILDSLGDSNACSAFLLMEEGVEEGKGITFRFTIGLFDVIGAD
jgi:hypothetical protein